VRALPQTVAFATAFGKVEVSYWSAPQLAVSVDGKPSDLVVSDTSTEHCDIVLAGVRRRFRLRRAGSRWSVDSHTGSSELEQLSRFPATSEHADLGSLLAPLPGVVLSLLVAVGDMVEEGQDLLVLEAMKMEHRVRAPHRGTIVELGVAIGQVIPAGAVLAVIE
jgi:biotin carboxyl carrier protein